VEVGSKPIPQKKLTADRRRSAFVDLCAENR
jgi:hypothetical protein